MLKASRLPLLALLLLARPTAQAQSQTKIDVVDRGKRATALVEVTSPRGEGSGSGFCIDKAGLFITNAHVVEGAAQVRLVVDIGLKSQRSLRAKVLRSDDEFDLALLKVDADLGLTPLELGKDDSLSLTDPVTAFGFPFGHLVAAASAPDITVIRSRVTSLRMDDGKLRFVQFDGQLNPGNSGGPVLDDEARVVGVAVATIRGAAINLAVPVRLLSEFLAAPGLVFDPPPLAYKDRSRPVTWTIKVLPPTPVSRLPEKLSVVVKLATGPENVRTLTAQPVGGGVFMVKVTPVPRDPDRKVELDAKFPTGEAYHFEVKDGDVKVGRQSFMLSDLRMLFGWPSPRAHTSRGQVAYGPITGLGKVKVKAGKKTVTIDLNRASLINARPLGPPQPVQAVEAVVEARQGSRVLATVHKRANLEGVPPIAGQVAPGVAGIAPIFPRPPRGGMRGGLDLEGDGGQLKMGGMLNVDGTPRGAGAAVRPPKIEIGPAKVVAGTVPEAGGPVRFVGHTNVLWDVAISPDGRRVLTASHDGTVGLWEIKTGKPLRTFPGHSDHVKGVAFLPDGLRGLSCGDDDTVRLWDLETGRELRRFSGHTADVQSVAVSADGRRVLSGSSDRTMRLWDLETGRELRRFVGHTADLGDVIFVPGGDRAMSAGSDKTVRLWDLETGREVRRFVGETGPPTCLAASPDGRLVLAGGADGVVRVWEIETGREVGRLVGHADSVLGVGFTPDGRHAISAGWSKDQSVRLWDVDGLRQVLCLRGFKAGLSEVAVSPDGRSIVAAVQDSTAELRDLLGLDPPAEVPGVAPLVRSLEGKISDVAVGGGGRYLLLTMKDAGKVVVFDINAADVVKTIPLAAPNALVAAGAKKFLVAFPDEKLIHRWDLETLTREVSNATLPVRGRLNGLAMGSDSDGPALAAWSPEPANSPAGPSQFSFIDLESLKVLRVGRLTAGGEQGLGAPSSSSGGSFTLHPLLRDRVLIRASAGGGLFGFSQASGSHHGFQTLSAEGDSLKAVYKIESAGHLVPGPDGRTVFTGRSGRLDAAGQPVGRAGAPPSGAPVAAVPTPDPSYFLTVEGSAVVSQPVRASIHVAGSGDRLVTVHGLDEMADVFKDEIRVKDDFTLEKRFHFVPAARLLVTIPPSNDRLVLRRLDLEQALAGLPGDYLFVVSPPVVIAKAGQPFEHRLEARSRKGGVKYTLSRGPAGLAVSAEGRLSWPSPRRTEGEDSTAVVIVSDASGREAFHTLSLHVN